MTDTANYAQTALAAVRRHYPGDLDDTFAAAYSLVALVKGEDATLSDVHDAWAMVRVLNRPDHPSLIPFPDLEADEAAKDQPFLDAIHAAARDLRGKAA